MKALLVEKFKYQELKRINTDGQRLYLCPDGSRLPSVTTILSKTKSAESKQALTEWRKRIGESKASEITTESANRGTRMHKFLEDFINNGYLKDFGSNPYSKQSHLMASKIVKEGLSKVDEVWGTEVSLYYPGLYSGTTDAVGVHQGVPAILDFKQSNKFKKREWIEDYFLQLVSYAQAHNAIHGTNIKKGVIIMAIPAELTADSDEQVSYQEFIIEGSEFDHYSNLWWDRVESYYLS